MQADFPGPVIFYQQSAGKIKVIVQESRKYFPDLHSNRSVGVQDNGGNKFYTFEAGRLPYRCGHMAGEESPDTRVQHSG